MRYHDFSEDRIASARVQAFRRYNEDPFGSSARRVPKTPQGVQGSSRHARTEAKGQTSRFPRPCRLVDRFRLRRRLLAGEFLPGETLPEHLTDSQVEAICIIQLLAVVIAKRLLINIAEQVERLDANVCSVQTALEQAPEIFHGIGMHVSVDVLNGVVNHLVLKLSESLIGGMPDRS
jgi:hypothetical protein